MQLNEDKPYDDINITPMLDLAYVLLVIFILMCTASVQGMKVNLPKAATAQTTPSSPLTLTLARRPAGDAQLYANGQPTDEPSVKRLVAELFAKDRDLQAVISADEGVDYGRVMRLVDLVKSVGVAKFALSTESRR